MPTQVERSANTREALLEAATELFGDAGFQNVSLAAVVKHASVSKGALYHHFSDKADLFRAVYDQSEAQLVMRLLDRAKTTDDPVEDLVSGCAEFLKLADDPAFRQIGMIDAPQVLGMEEWRAIDAEHGLGLLRDGLQRVAENGLLADADLDLTARMILAVLTEAAALAATASTSRKPAIRRDVLRVVRAICS